MGRRLVLLLLGGILMASILELTNGTVSFDFFSRHNRFRLDKWELALAPVKGGGEWADSPSMEGRRLVDSVYGNAIETLHLKGQASCPADFYSALSGLFTLLEQARAYATTTHQDTPVYLRVREEDEPGYRYALLHDWSVPGLPAPHGDRPLLQRNHSAALDQFTLLLERGPWLNHPPGESACVEVSGVGAFRLATTTIQAAPLANDDDAYARNNALNFTSDLFLGRDATYANSTGIRFRKINVPAGATILSAYITFVADGNLSAKPVSVRIYGEDNGNPAAFTTYPDFIARARTGSYVNWYNLPSWTLGVSYNSPDLAALVQEIIARPDWVAGQDMAFFVQDNGSPANAYRSAAAYDHPTYTEPVLTILYTAAADTPYGRTATCADEVYVGNRSNRANISHVFRYDASTGLYSANLQGNLYYSLLPNPVQNGDIIYFGCSTALANSGSFTSLVFNLTNPAVYVGAARMDWQYYSSIGGGTWIAPALQDNTDVGPGPFSRSGVCSAHWVAGDTWIPATINGVTAYWMRCVATVGAGDSISTPAQYDRDVYAVTWPDVEIAAAQLNGDLPALALITVRNQSDNAGVMPASHCPGYANRVLIGVRQLDRGANFNAYFNFSDDQNPPGVSWNRFPVGTWARNTYPSHPADHYYSWAPGAVLPLTDIAQIEYDPAIAPEYYGTFRVFLIGGQVLGSAGDLRVQLSLRTGSSPYPATIWQSPLLVVEQGTWAGMDLGTLAFPEELSRSDLHQGMTLYLAMSSDTATPGVLMRFMELVLMPADEALWDAWDPNPPYGWLGGRAAPVAPTVHRYLALDSVTRPKTPRRAVVYDEEAGYVAVPHWRVVTPGRFLLNTGVAQRLWFLAAHCDAASGAYAYYSQLCHRVQVQAVERWQAFRGA